MGLLPTLGVYVAGILLADHCADPLSRLWLALPLPLALLALLLRRTRGSALLQLLFFLALGGALHLLQLRPPADAQHIAHLLSDEAVTVEGVVRNLAPRSAGGASLVLDLAALETRHGVTTARGAVALTVLDGTPSCRPGDRIRCRTRLRAPRPFGTPGEPDWPRYLAARGIFARGTVATGDALLILRRESGWHAALQRRRQATGVAIDRVVPSTEAPLVRALVTGDKGGIAPETRDLLARGGVSHLFAISGLHLGLIASALLIPGLYLWRRSETLLLWQPPRRILPLLLLPALLFFYLWTGEAVSTLRALLMYAAAVLLLLRARRSAPLQILAAAALLVLLVAPATLFEPAFQLSFAAVAGMALLLPSAFDAIATRPRWQRLPLAAALTTTAATLATLPLVAWHFHLLAPAGLLLNLPAIPLVGFLAVPVGLLGAFALPLAPELAAGALQWCGWINALLLELTRALLKWPGLGGTWFYAPPLRLVALACICLALLLPWQRLWLRWRLALLAAALPLWLFPWPQQPQPSLIAFSVGQGESLLVTTGDGFRLLVDGGGSPRSAFDPGRQLVAPALGRLGITRLDAVLLTHGHPDHADGLRHVLAAIPTGEFWAAFDQELAPELAEVLSRNAIPQRRFPPGWTALPAQRLRLYTPPRAANENDRSLVLHADFGSQSVLLTGDLEARGVSTLLHDPGTPPASLLKLPHHGSRHSAPGLLLEQLRPSLTLVSVGFDNPYSLPHRDTLAELERRGIPLLRTDADGTVRFVPRERGWEAGRWLNGDFR